MDKALIGKLMLGIPIGVVCSALFILCVIAGIAEDIESYGGWRPWLKSWMWVIIAWGYVLTALYLIMSDITIIHTAL